MKKVLPILLVAAMALPALGDVAVTAVDKVPGDGILQITITPSGGAAIRGVALELDTETGDAVIDGSGDVVIVDNKLNTNIDYFYTNGIGIVVGDTPAGEGNPIANPAAAGVLDPTGGAANFSISSGYLDAAGGQAGQLDPIVIEVAYTLSADSTISIVADALRGGIVGDDLGTVTYPAADTLITATGGMTCRDMLTAAEQADYDAYIAAGKDPSCWCWRYQCHGDVDNATETALKYRVYGLDIAEIVANWKAKITTANPCADIDHAYETALKYRVYSLDIAKVVENWKKKDSALTDCPTYLAP